MDESPLPPVRDECEWDTCRRSQDACPLYRRGMETILRSCPIECLLSRDHVDEECRLIGLLANHISGPEDRPATRQLGNECVRRGVSQILVLEDVLEDVANE